MQVSYARVSTFDQNLSLQRDALEEAGCERIFDDTFSCSKANSKVKRPEFDATLDQLRAGDTLVIWRLDQPGRSLTGLFEFMPLR